ncbi:hypothetical protein [Saccharibacillus sacchari]|uniref:Uncharacterized protein n=1 Tax=Saccharibacillus sacchari TaxID=456493 RepID=A0ACC6P8X5_9BACL
MNKKMLLLVSCMIHLAALVLLFIVQKNMDIFGMFAFVLLPLLFSLALVWWSQVKLKQVELRNLGIIYSIPNIVYITAALFIIYRNMDSIFATSQKYQSEYMTVSSGNSPWLSYIILAVLTLTLHYFICNLVLRKTVKNVG